MTEEEEIDLITMLGLVDEDVVHVDIDHEDPAGFSVLVTEGDRITHVMFGWGAAGLYATVSTYVGLDNPVPVTDAVIVPLGDTVSIINPTAE
jgi:hypothetical protein